MRVTPAGATGAPAREIVGRLERVGGVETIGAVVAAVPLSTPLSGVITAAFIGASRITEGARSRGIGGVSGGTVAGGGANALSWRRVCSTGGATGFDTGATWGAGGTRRTVTSASRSCTRFSTHERADVIAKNADANSAPVATTEMPMLDQTESGRRSNH
jgi:hypothetical protein